MAPPELRERVVGDVQLAAHDSPVPGVVDGGPDPDAAAVPGTLLPAVPARRRSLAARGVAVALVVAALAGGVAMLWDGRLVALREVPAVPLAPVTSGPATSVLSPSTGAAAGPFAGAESDPLANVVPDAPRADSTTAASAPPATGTGPPRTTTSAPSPGSAMPPGPAATPILNSPPPDTTTDPTPPPPRIVEQNVSPPRLGSRGCPEDRADVRVTLAAEAPATAVVLSWEGTDESGSMPMRGSSTTWSGSLGPFGEPGRVQWSVTASNAAGSITGPAETITVTSCTGLRSTG